jgi:hypothetical protein
VHFYGVAQSNCYLTPGNIGIKRGTTGKGEFSFTDVVSLDIKSSSQSICTVSSLCAFLLGECLNTVGSNLLGSNIKVIKLDGVMPGRAPPTEMVDVSLPVVVQHVAGSAANVELMLYLRAPLLHALRASVVSSRWDLFQNRAKEVVPSAKLNKAAFALLVGHGRATIDGALAGSGMPGPNQTLSTLESIMRTHFDSNFSGFAVALAAAHLKKTSGKRKATCESPAPGDACDSPHNKDGPRSRTSIPYLAGICLDAYVDEYTGAKGDVRKALIKSIKDHMDAQDPMWALSLVVIEGAMANRMKDVNKKTRVAAMANLDEAAQQREDGTE